MQNVPARPATADVRGPAAPAPAPAPEDDVPASLPGTWTAHLCIAGDQSWIRLQEARSGEFHTLSRSGQDPARIQWNLDVKRESQLTSLDHMRASVTVQNPRIFRGRGDGRPYGASAGNCAGFTRDAWQFYSGEWYPLASPPTAAALRELVLRRHPPQPAKVYSTPPDQNQPPRPSRGR